MSCVLQRLIGWNFSLLNIMNNMIVTYTTRKVALSAEVDLKGFSGGLSPPLFWGKFGCLYRESVKHDWRGPPLRQSVGPPLVKISGSTTDQDLTKQWSLRYRQTSFTKFKSILLSKCQFNHYNALFKRN